ncbi:MAG: F-type H+-transporting ATPase subunit delta [Candidatus Eremiobacteraeota bacterium]|jgi:F-type H+-transporting ATPase subunit delta|nr:F-type H+-transporting ATPase subunit delta [Candidatus Eremiobacteraeota bacterium]
MPNETLARRYATAVFQLAQDAGKVGPVQHDLHTFVAALAADEDVRKFFRSPVVDRKEKETIVAQAFSRLDPIALHTVLLLVRKRRENMVEEIVAQYDVLERQARGAQPLQVTSARELSRSQFDAIVGRLTATYHTKFDVTQSVDPSLIGGVRITMGDKLADGTVAGRLDDIARLLSTN